MSNNRHLFKIKITRISREMLFLISANMLRLKVVLQKISGVKGQCRAAYLWPRLTDT